MISEETQIKHKGGSPKKQSTEKVNTASGFPKQNIIMVKQKLQMPE